MQFNELGNFSMMTYTPTSTKKRALNAPFLPPRKFLRLEQVDALADIVTRISISLPPIDFLQFESVNKRVRGSAGSGWQMKQYDYPEWSECESLPDEEKAKWNVCLTEALGKFCKKYLLPRKKWYQPLDCAQEIHESYSGLMERFPLFGSFVEMIMLNIASLSPIISEDLKQRRVQVLKHAISGRWGGELFLQTLFEIHDYRVKEEELLIEDARKTITNYVQNAIKKQATSVCLYGYYFFREDGGAQDGTNEIVKELVVCGAEAGYFDALERFLGDFDEDLENNEEKLEAVKPLIEKWGRFPLLLRYYADLLGKEKEPDTKLIDQLRAEADGYEKNKE